MSCPRMTLSVILTISYSEWFFSTTHMIFTKHGLTLRLLETFQLALCHVARTDILTFRLHVGVNRVPYLKLTGWQSNNLLFIFSCPEDGGY